MKPYTLLRCIVSLSFVAVAVACTSLTPAGMMAASRLDPIKTPPDQIAVAFAVPQTLRLSDGDAEFRIAFAGGPADAPILLEKTAVLDIRPAAQDGPRSSNGEEQIYIARIPPADSPAIAEILRQIRTLQAKGIEGEGNLGILIGGGCYMQTIPESLVFSTWLKTNPEDGFVQVTRRANLFDAINARDATLLRAALTRCEN